jgi:hypothetical protein
MRKLAHRVEQAGPVPYGYHYRKGSMVENTEHLFRELVGFRLI